MTAVLAYMTTAETSPYFWLFLLLGCLAIIGAAGLSFLESLRTFVRHRR